MKMPEANLKGKIYKEVLVVIGLLLTIMEL